MDGNDTTYITLLTARWLPTTHYNDKENIQKKSKHFFQIYIFCFRPLLWFLNIAPYYYSDNILIIMVVILIIITFIADAVIILSSVRCQIRTDHEMMT